MELSALQNSKNQFFFNLHNFDDEVIDDEVLEEEEDLPPPPPVFTEQELEAAKKKAFQDGHAQGKKEVEESRAQALAEMMQKLAEDTKQLFAAEEAREKTYEREAVALCRGIFQSVFPQAQEKHGFDALITQLEDILRSQSGQRQIEVRVGEDYVQGVEAFMSKLSGQNPELNFTVVPDETLGAGAFKLAWVDGGAIYDIKAISDRILSTLDETLAGTAVNVHDTNDKESEEPGAIDESDDEVNRGNPITEESNE